MKVSALISTAISLLFIFIPSNGQTAGHSSRDHKEPLQHEAHEHGVARLTLAVDGKQLEITLQSPAANMVGFEHSATTDEEWQKLAEVKVILAKGQNLFRINPEADCSLKNSEVQSALFEHVDHMNGETHGDVDANWLFTCADPSALRTVTTGFFASFPGGFEKIMFEWITATSASAVTIDHDDVIELNNEHY